LFSFAELTERGYRTNIHCTIVEVSTRQSQHGFQSSQARLYIKLLSTKRLELRLNVTQYNRTKTHESTKNTHTQRARQTDRQTNKQTNKSCVDQLPTSAVHEAPLAFATERRAAALHLLLSAGRAAIDSYFLPDGRTAANPQQ